MTQLSPLPLRQPGEVISTIRYRPETGGDANNQRFIALFRHRDNRIWQARLSQQSITVAGHTYEHNAVVSCSGCRSWTFLSETMDQSKRTVSSFANLNLDAYRRLIADANGTSDHPIAGDIGVFRIRVARPSVRQPGVRTGTVTVEITGIARIDGAQIIVFPVADELAGILGSVCASGTLALVPQGINEIPNETSTGGFLTTQGRGLRGVQVPVVNDDELTQAIQRLRSDTLEGAVSGLTTGRYATTHRSHERVLDFHIDDAEGTQHAE